MQQLTWVHAAAVAIGASFGSVARWLASIWLNPMWAGFPLGTLFVNCLGGLLIGMAMAWLARSPDEMLRLLLVTGFLGGFTTFSAFSMESLHLLQEDRWAMAALHSLTHVLGALACAGAGLKLARMLLS